MADETDPQEPAPVELDVPPTIPGRIARWTATARVLRSQVEAARRRHRSLDLALDVVERDSTIGGGTLGGALALPPVRLLLPLALFLVAAIGVYADTTEQSPSEVASRSGLTGLIAKEVAAAATSGQTPLLITSSSRRRGYAGHG